MRSSPRRTFPSKKLPHSSHKPGQAGSNQSLELHLLRSLPTWIAYLPTLLAPPSTTSHLLGIRGVGILSRGGRESPRPLNRARQAVFNIQSSVHSCSLLALFMSSSPGFLHQQWLPGPGIYCPASGSSHLCPSKTMKRQYRVLDTLGSLLMILNTYSWAVEYPGTPIRVHPHTASPILKASPTLSPNSTTIPAASTPTTKGHFSTSNPV